MENYLLAKGKYRFMDKNIERFEDLFEDCTNKGRKIKKNEYHESGQYAIVDQGQKEIAGYTDETDGVYKDVPVILFGDHTRIIKYIDIPFFLGADGVKLLKCKREDANYKYLYYALRNAKIPDTGYNRHFKWLKEIKIMYPDSTQQQKIVDVLDKVENIIACRKRQIEELDCLVKSRFIEMFGEPKLNPYGFPIHKLSEYIGFLTSGSRGWAKYCVDDGIEWFITIKNVKDCHISIDNMQSINPPNNAEAKRTKVQQGDLLISITADLGRTGVVTKKIAEHGAYINQHLICIRLNQAVLNPLYVAYFMESEAGKEQFESRNQSAVKAGLNFNSINSLKLIVPPMELQNGFVNFVKNVGILKVTVQKSLDELQFLYDSLMQKYFG